MSTELVPKVFSCVAFVHVHSHGRGKLDLRAIKCIFIGYSTAQKGYKCYNITIRKTYVSIDVTFVEHESYFSQRYLQGEISTIEDKDLFFERAFYSQFNSLVVPSYSI